MTIGTELDDKVFIIKLLKELKQFLHDDPNGNMEIFFTEFFKDYIVYNYYEY